MKFKVGDKITGLAGDNRYSITTEKAIMEVTGHKVDNMDNDDGDDGNDIVVKILEYEGDKDEIGGTYPVESKHFRKINKPFSVKFKVGDKVKHKKTGLIDTVKLAPGIKEYDERGYSDAKAGLLLESNTWVYQKFWEKVNKEMNNKQPVYWECTDNGSKKFWAAHIIKRDAKFVLARKWGRIGNNPQTIEQVFNDKNEAEEILKKLIRAKENKGYKPIF